MSSLVELENLIRIGGKGKRVRMSNIRKLVVIHSVCVLLSTTSAIGLGTAAAQARSGNVPNPSLASIVKDGEELNGWKLGPDRSVKPSFGLDFASCRIQETPLDC